MEHNRALASSLYLVGYYLGASLGGLYLHPFWEQGGLWGLVLGIELVLMITAGLSLWLGHLKGRVAPACTLTPQGQAPVNGPSPHRPS